MNVTQTIQEHIPDSARTDGIKDLIDNGRRSTACSRSTSTSPIFIRANIITLQTAVHAATNPSDFERALHFE